ncbi:MAG: ATP-binding cassette domain-containing protein [Turicibacter sp.]|jgi:ABC-2 type transport system ATP-binding protein|uniref:ATP-binding cassette domain-containing protein n=1 Tax=unclassified Turicibacter TaxID=2638206 RepID=UPI00137A1D52|nr:MULTISPECIES: ATP-binding cassette domain-containing protein [unclassified Turicibacter]MCI8701136.1 ATP-binding cassette domain-containing protein [Turicibacter sp.]MCI9350346.1 ATP-binding cassette domain-containing protein [Turicibacter sp.]MCU7204307.1 ATP-binding cassette domain-containing protein [Turicibacter sp. TA25]MCU7210116.1 ATP-binding cassette domain-containing protein [Turicibacter sp. 1E2]NCE79374.1 ATP-binding cassette domain-containing protein [Turicibacter sp. TS3]
MHNVVLMNVSKTIGHDDVLKNISATFESGKIYGIFGRNGSGKTMLFRAICGLIKITTGEIHFNDLKLHRDVSYAPNVGVIIETPSFWKEFSGFENLKMLASIQGKITDVEIIESLRRVGLDPQDKRPVKKYSLGMKQRLAIAQGIMENPDLIVFDEPTNALDEEAVQLLRQILIEEKERGAIVLIASHNKDDIRLLADVFMKMESGRLSEVTTYE